MKSAAGGTEAYDDAILDESRLDGALALSREAGWNQTADDWRLFFRYATVFGRVRRRDGALVGSATALPLGTRLAWVGMVLVTTPERRRGHGRSLMRRALAHIEAAGAVAGLDATPAGRGLYESLGFEDSAALFRMSRQPSSPSGGGAALDSGLRPAAPADLSAICTYDAQAFGADRTMILHDLHRRLPAAAFIAGPAGRLTGYVLARPGRVAYQIGPLVADDADTAKRLLSAALATLSGPVFVDVFSGHGGFRQWLASLGFTEQRPFTRMLNGPAELPLDRTVLSAGPELG